MASDGDNSKNQGNPLLKVAADNESSYPVVFQASPACPNFAFDWNFGDGSVVTNVGPNPHHNFAKAGVYTVTVTARCIACQGAPMSATVVVGIATVEEVDTTVHATPQPNASLGTASYADDPPYQAFHDPSQNVIAGKPAGSAVALPLGISPVDMECITTPDYNDPTFGAQIQSMLKWQYPQDGSMKLSPATGTNTTVTFTADGISQISCFLDAAGTGKLASSDASVSVNTEIATVMPTAAPDVEVYETNLKQDTTHAAPGDILLISGTANISNLPSNGFSIQATLSVNSIDSSFIKNISTIFVQNVTGLTFAGNYSPGNPIRYVFTSSPAQLPQEVLCPGSNFIVTPVLDAGTFIPINGGDTPSTSAPGTFTPLSPGERNGQTRTITWVDSPNVSLPQIQVCGSGNGLNSVSGGESFSTYVVAFGTQFPHSYAVIGRTDWTVTWDGTVSQPDLIWTPDNTTGMSKTAFLEDGYPISGASAGIIVNPPIANKILSEDGQ
jgi:hypothetical protein